MKKLALAFLLGVLTVFGCATPIASSEPTRIDRSITSPCLDYDVWVYIKKTDAFEPTCIVVVHIPKHSLQGDFENCPAQDTKMVGQGRYGFSTFAGMKVVTIPKGHLNNPKNYTTKAPKTIKIPADNISVWHANK